MGDQTRAISPWILTGAHLCTPLSIHINLQTMLLGHPSTQYLLKARSPDWMHCICKGKYNCWFFQHLHSQACQCFGCDTTHRVSSPTIDPPPQYSEGMSSWLNHLWVETSLDASWEQRGFVGWTLSGAHREVKDIPAIVGLKFFLPHPCLSSSP